MKIAISLDSCSDLTDELIKQFDFKVIPFNIQLGSRSVSDGELKVEEIFKFVDDTGQLPKTAAINEYHYKEHFVKILNQGYDAVIHISLSSKISSTCSNAERAAASIKNCYVVDSLSLSTGISLSAIYCKSLIDQNLDLAEILKKVRNRVKSVQASFVIEKVNYLYKGGRCSLISFLGANLLRIKPQIVLRDGVMVPGKKFRGPLSICLNKYVESTLQEFSHPDKEIIFITYTSWNNQNEIEKTYARLKEYGFKTIYITRAHSTIATHCGANCIGILYFNDGNKIN